MRERLLKMKTATPASGWLIVRLVHDHCYYSQGTGVCLMGYGSTLAVLYKPEVTCCAQGRLLGIKDSFLQRVAEAAINLAGPCDANVPRSSSRILAELGREEERFRTTLDSGEKVLEV